MAREPFYDEVFTEWMSAKSFGGILHALRLDSAPPLYYFVCHVLPWPRLVSLGCASVALAAMLWRRYFIAAALTAVFPPAVLLSVDARAYAMCAMFVALGVLALDARRLWLAAAALLLAAYSHYLGVLFLPLLVPHWRQVFAAAAIYAPGLAFALTQPTDLATAWRGALQYPYSLFAAPPAALSVAMAVLALVALARRPSRFAWMTLVPVACAIAIGMTGRNMYFPYRFEAVLAPPLMLWFDTSLAQWRPAVRRVLTGSLIAGGALATYVGIVDHAARPLDPYREAAIVARRVAGREPLVASGYVWLEAEMQPGAPVIAFPHEQGDHPGWRSYAPSAALASEVAALPPRFFWTGERTAPELPSLRSRYAMQLVFANDRAVVVRMVLTPTLH